MMTELSGRLNHFRGDRPFYRELAIVAAPMAFQQLVANSLMFIDNLMVGRLGEQAMAGIAITNKYFFILQVAFIAITAGLGIFISQYFGADDHEKGQGLFMIMVISSLLVAFFFVGLASVFPRFILSIFADDPRTIETGLAYLGAVRFAFIPMAFSLAAMTALRSIGQTRVPMLVGILVLGMNTSLNYLLIFGRLGLPALGTRGAGVATLTARLVEAALYIVLLAPGRRYFSLRLAPIRKLTRAIIGQVARKTSQLMLNEFLWSVGMTILFWTYSQLGEKYIPSLTIADTTANFSFIALNGISAAISVQVGARLGAGKFDEAYRNAKRLIALGMACAALFGVVVLLLSGKIPLLFNVSDDVRHMATMMLRAQVLVYVLLSMNTMVFFLLRIGGDMQGALMMDAAFIWLLLIPGALLISLIIKPSLLILYLFIQGVEIYKIPVTVHLFRRGRWIRNLT
jgi:putative MATE family efflux protein